MGGGLMVARRRLVPIPSSLKDAREEQLLTPAEIVLSERLREFLSRPSSTWTRQEVEATAKALKEVSVDLREKRRRSRREWGEQRLGGRLELFRDHLGDRSSNVDGVLFARSALKRQSFQERKDNILAGDVSRKR
jgi:hypothetical protein